MKYIGVLTLGFRFLNIKYFLKVKTLLSWILTYSNINKNIYKDIFIVKCKFYNMGILSTKNLFTIMGML